MSVPALTGVMQHPHRFNFFQLVRLLHRGAPELAEVSSPNASGTQSAEPQSRGARPLPAEDRVRFRSVAELRFPTSAVTAVRSRTVASLRGVPETPDACLIEVASTLLGLIGPNGVLPEHDTRTVIDSIRSSDVALHRFLDIFYHRVMLLFYRAWRKHQISVAYEVAATEPEAGPDAFTTCLQQALGLNASAIEQMQVPVSVPLHYAGCLLSGRSAGGLETMLSSYFRVPVRVAQFCGRWLFLGESEVTRVASAADTSRYARLGQDFVIGTRLWDVRSQFRIAIGPMDFPSFQRFLPTGTDWPAICELVRFYVGMEFDFDIELSLESESAPTWTLSLDTDAGRLGWTTWCGASSGPGAIRKVGLRVDEHT